MNQIKVAFLSLCLLLAGQMVVYSQCLPVLRPDSTQFSTDLGVNCVATDNNMLYLGGGFTKIGKKTGSFIGLDTSLGNPKALNIWPKISGDVYCATQDGVGGWYVGGYFTMVGTQSRTNLVRIHANGQVDAWAPNPNNIVHAMCTNNGILYVGGEFTSASGQTRNRLAAYNISTGALTTWSPSADAPVFVLATSGNKVYIGGMFTTINGSTRQRVASVYMSTGGLTLWSAVLNGDVRAIAFAGSNVYLGGSFLQVNFGPKGKLAAIDTTTGLATPWNPNANSNVYSLVLSGDKFLVAGNFTTIGGQTRNYVAEIDSSTGLATPFNVNIPVGSHIIYSLKERGNRLYVGGLFNVPGNQPRDNFAVYNRTNGSLLPITFHSNTPVTTITLENELIYLGCTAAPFNNNLGTCIGYKYRSRLAAIDMNTDTLTSWAPEADSTVYALTATNGYLYAGGEFLSIGTQLRTRLAAIDMITSLAVPGWNPTANARVSQILPFGSKLYLAGNFTTLNSIARNYTGALSIVNGTTSTWNPNPNAMVVHLAPTHHSILVSGFYSAIGGQSRQLLAEIDTSSGSVASSWNPSPNSAGSVCTVTGDTVYVGGPFVNIGGQPRNYIAAIRLSNGSVLNWNPNGDQAVRHIEKNGNDVYVMGQFYNIGGQPAPALALLNGISGSAAPWTSYTSATIGLRCLKKGNGRLFVSTTGTVTNTNLQGFVQYDLAPTSPVISISGNATPCAGSSVVFTASTNNPAGSFQWKVNNVNVGTNANSYTYIPAQNDQVSCELTSAATSCYPASVATSNIIPVIPVPVTMPTITISSTTNNICAGTTVIFTAIANVAGAVYQWKVNGVNAGTNSSSYPFVPANGDVVTCQLTISGGCYSPQSVTSNAITMTVNPNASFGVFINCTSMNVCSGTYVTFYTIGPPLPPAFYQWKVNGNNVGVDSTQFTYQPNSGDVITCTVSPLSGCYSPASVTSIGITMIVNSYISPQVYISGPATVCAGSSATYNANSGAMGVFHWQVNNVNVGTNATSYSYVPTAGDQVRCIFMTSTGFGCYSPLTDTSNIVTVVITQPVQPVISISTDSTNPCSGIPVSFNASSNIINGNYQWKVNSINSGTNSSVYSYVPLNNDIVDCQVTAGTGGCFTANSATSNAININVQPTLDPQISLSGPVSATLFSPVTITANMVNAPANYSIDWLNNGFVFNNTNTPTTYYYKQPGNDMITARLMPLAGCFSPDTSAPHLVSVVSDVRDLTRQNMVTIFPNPATNAVTVAGLKVRDQILVTDITSKIVARWEATTAIQSFNIAALSAGPYLLNIAEKDGMVRASFLMQKQ